jgi:2-(1,2-epoxy-1,2-dihydrophenyl)acetyl-CoA isomerase
MSFYAELREQGESASERFIDVTRRADSAVLTFAEPERLNVLSAPLVVQTKAALAELVADRDIRSVVITGAGRGFCAGGDLKMMRLAEDALADGGDTTDIWRWIRYEFGGIARLIARSDTTFVAAINGPAAGVGLAWALTCDVILASERAVLVPAFGRLGLVPEVGTSWALTRRLGYQGAFAFFAGGRPVEADEALRLGLVQEVTPHDELASAADRWCERIAAMPPHALAMAKGLLRTAADSSWEASLAMEEFAEPNCFTTPEFQRTVRELLERGPGSS